MAMTVTVQKWGNSLGVRIPKVVAQTAGIDEGSEVEVAVRRGKVVLKPVEVPSLAELLSQIKPHSRPQLVEWGKPVGNEAW
jgi:antitoxin MazE